MHEPVDIAWTKNEAAAKLKRIPAPAMLTVARRTSTLSGLGIVRTYDVQKISFAQACRVISQTLIVNEQRKGNTSLFLKNAGMVSIAQPHCCKFGAFIVERGFVFAQLRDVLTAEDSAVVTEKDDHRRLVFP